MLPMRELHAACNDEMNARDSTKRLILSWVNCCDADAVVCEASKYSDMHLFGLGLCYVMYTHDPLDGHGYNTHEELGEFNIPLEMEIRQHVHKPGIKAPLVGKCDITFHCTPKAMIKAKLERRKK